MESNQAMKSDFGITISSELLIGAGQGLTINDVGWIGEVCGAARGSRGLAMRPLGQAVPHDKNLHETNGVCSATHHWCEY